MICNKNKCTGCFACYNICPKKAIEMYEDEFGYIYPHINHEKCVNCGLCKKVCPVLNNVNSNEPVDTYAMIAKDSYKRKESSSGGAATIFAEKIIELGGVVYGCTYSKGCYIKHIRIDKIEELKKIKGSKYVHSYVLDTFKNVRNDLNNNKKVLYIGTPCQIAGLKNYIGNYNKSDNLYLIDLICHGVPSQKYLKECLSNSKEDDISFRTENGFVFREYDNNKIINETDSRDFLYYRAFFEALIFRNNCYTCQYAKKERCSDITLGDFWGLKSDSKFYKERKKGVSLILINSKKGEDLLRAAKGSMLLEKREYQEASNGNNQLNNPKKKNKKYNKFQKLYIKYGFIKSYKKINRFALLKNKLRKNKLLSKIYNYIKK